ncbi:MAG: DUF2254 family protein [Oligoflexus sp.]
MTKKGRMVWDQIHSSYWFTPSLMVMISILLVYFSLQIDYRIKAEDFPSWMLYFAGGHGGAREVLSTIAGTIITVAGVTFSVTIVTLSLASQQYGPRLLRNFLRDRSVQFTLGTFVSTFTFCLLVLRSITGDNSLSDENFVPHISVTVGVLVAIFNIFVFIGIVSLRYKKAGLKSSINSVCSICVHIPRNIHSKANELIR